MPSFSRNGGSGVLDSIKSKLGFRSNEDQYDDYGDYEDSGEYDDYGEDYDAYSDNFDDYSTYDEDQGASDSDMDRYGEVVERDASARRRRRSYTDVASSDFNDRRQGANSFTPLVSIEDIRANTHRTMSNTPSGVRSSSLTRHEFRSSDYMASGSLEHEFISETHGSSAAEEPRRASGYDALFSSTTSASSRRDDAETMTQVDAAPSVHPSRTVVVLAPREYAEAEKVSRSLKAGDAVVLNLKTVPGDLSKRLLDFSFGVASALDVNVDCIADKVFALTRYTQLSDAEIMRLRGQGVL